MTKRKYLTFTNDVAPVHDGVYQREFSRCGSQRWFWAKFDNGRWYQAHSTYAAANACRSKWSESVYQVGGVSHLSSLRWRGLEYHEYMRCKGEQNAIQRQIG